MELTAIGVESDFSKFSEQLNTLSLAQRRLTALSQSIEQEQPPLLDKRFKTAQHLHFSEEQIEKEQQLSESQYQAWLAQNNS